LHDLYTLNTTGKDVSLNNGAGGSSNNMFVMSFQSQTLPYLFTKSNSIASCYIPQKVEMNSNADIQTSGRSAVVVLDSAQTYFTLRDIMLDDKSINFIQVSEKANVTEADTLNNYLMTEPFLITDNSKFTYSILYGVLDSLKALTSLVKNDYITFKVELLDKTNRVLKTFHNITYNKQNIIGNKKNSYNIHMNGIGNQEVKMRFLINKNVTAQCFMVDSHTKVDKNSLSKLSEYEEIDFISETIKEYALDQNYPNPFNPSTTIKYQIPIAGMVTLKIYDVLGKEIALLVNEYKDKGRYNINFDASYLASGVYIYQIKSNEYTSSIIMMLIK
jgi:hypothetical protein